MKTTMRYHFTQTNLAFIKTENKCWQECGEDGTFVHYWWECKMVQTLCKNSVMLPQNIKQNYHFVKKYKKAKR